MTANADKAEEAPAQACQERYVYVCAHTLAARLPMLKAPGLSVIQVSCRAQAAVTC